MYSAAFPTPGTDATVIEDPAGACSDAAEDPDPGIWQPASSTAAAAAQPAAIRARPLLQGRAGQRRAGVTFIAPRRQTADHGSSEQVAPAERTSTRGCD
jgi:hypothetical protein